MGRKWQKELERRIADPTLTAEEKCTAELVVYGGLDAASDL